MTTPIAFAPTVGPGEILPFAADRDPDKVALVTPERRMTYRELEEASRCVAVALQYRGIGDGDVVSLYGQNSWEWIVSYHGVLRAGAVVNPVNVMLTAPELTYVLNNCGARALFTGAAQADMAGAAVANSPSIDLAVSFGLPRSGFAAFSALVQTARGLPLVQVQRLPRDLCAIAYTSGTTGQPKGAMQSQQAVLLNCALAATMHGRSHDEVVVTALPAAHVYGNIAINATFLVGGTVVLMERFDAAEALRLLAAERATMFEGVPAMYSMILAEPALAEADLTSLRKSSIGGQTFAVSVLEKWQQRAKVPLIELWGMTELAGLGATHSVYAPPLAGSIGVAAPGIEMRIAALDGASDEVPPGEPGELVVRGPLVMLGYYGNPEATAEVLDAKGWLHTGDVAYADETGHFFVIDRIKDMIVTAGYNVYPAEIERVVAAHHDVAMVAVGRWADEVRGEVAVAYVVPAEGADLSEQQIIDHCRDHLAAYKRPRAVIFVDRLPTTSSGKVMRRKLTRPASPESLGGDCGRPTAPAL